MTMVSFFLSTVESCGCDHSISFREEEVCPSIPKKEGSQGKSSTESKTSPPHRPPSWLIVGGVGGLVEIGAVFVYSFLVGGFG